MSPERCTSQEEITFLQEFRLDRKSLDRLIKKDKVNTEKFSHQIDRLREELKQEGYEVFTSFDIYQGLPTSIILQGKSSMPIAVMNLPTLEFDFSRLAAPRNLPYRPKRLYSNKVRLT